MGHQHKYPSEGKLDIPEAPKQKEMTKPVMDADHEVKFTPKTEEKPPVPKDLSGPKFSLEDREHVYTGLDLNLDQERPRKVTTELIAPIYADEERDMKTHHFKANHDKCQCNVNVVSTLTEISFLFTGSGHARGNDPTPSGKSKINPYMIT